MFVYAVCCMSVRVYTPFWRLAEPSCLTLARVQALIEKYNIPYQHIIVDDEVDFEDQVRMFATTGLLVSVHGAGLMNQIFMPPGSVTIEIFPNHVKHVLYERIAHYAGVYHFKVRLRVSYRRSTVVSAAPCAAHVIGNSFVHVLVVTHFGPCCKRLLLLRSMQENTSRTLRRTMLPTTVTTVTKC